MGQKRLKILMLGFNDNKLLGHVYSIYQSLPECYDKKLIVLQQINGRNLYSKFKTDSYFGKKFFLLYNKLNGLKRLLYTRSKLYVDADKLEYCFVDNEFGGMSAKRILSECKGFNPDIISIHWVANFITSKTIKKLYEFTGAKLCFFFVDEAHMTGGCHYPVDCNGYKNGCHDCPALAKRKDIAQIQMQIRTKNLSGIPKIVMGSPYDCRKAKSSIIFQNAIFYPFIEIPKVNISPSDKSREHFGFSDGEFVIMIGAASLSDVRKGLKYSLQAIRKFVNTYPNVCILVPGHNSVALQETLAGIKVVSPGYIDIDELFMAFCASNCFLSTTIADSGPMMVNYSIATGTPVVSFDLGIAQDLVIHKRTGYIAKYKDVSDLVNGLDYIFHSDQSIMRQNCLDLIAELDKKPKWYEKFYSDFLSGELNQAN